MIGKIYNVVMVVLFSLFAVGCTIYLKPCPKKLESYQPTLTYNFYQFYAAEFEGQIGKDVNDMIHFGLNYLDSTYWVRISTGDSLHLSDDYFTGYYSVNERGTVILYGDSPFLNDTYQIVTSKRSKQAPFHAKYKLTGTYRTHFGKKQLGAYCEINFPWELQECVIGE